MRSAFRFRLQKLLSSLFYPGDNRAPRQDTSLSEQESPAFAGQQQPDEVLDLARMQDLVTNLGDSLQDVIDSYVEDTPLQIQKLQQAFENDDWEALQRTAHSLKSSSGIFGAAQMVALCLSLEMMPQTRRQAVPDLIRAISSAYEQARVMLNLYRTDGNTSE